MALSQYDPIAFDAERRARLALEYARSRHARQDNSAFMHNMEKILAPLSNQERALVSLRCMTISLIQLNAALRGFEPNTHP